uniref:MjHSP70-2-like protein n=1 Tax=Metapenaeus ensis majanivirus TaxID=2984279 RepID=A0A9C7BMV7_9VIRU|nr:MAG: MjHSP70-2-like protein [Metapenaeus ensis majanivirus]
MSTVKENRKEWPIIGIDLGTTYSCVGIYQNGKVEIIANDQGNRTTPSMVAFTEYERLIGDAAKNQITINPYNTVYDAKRLIGLRYDNRIIEEEKKFWSFEVINVDEKPKIQVDYKNDKKLFTPEEISAMVLSKMKEVAETYLGEEVKHAVVTVPAYFNDAQRQATKDAGKIANLNIMRIINEPTAAAIAYGLSEKNKNDDGNIKNILVFDLGGGTFDVSILILDDGVFEVKATAGDTHLGGEDFDNKLVDHFIDEIKKKYKQDISGNRRALRRLKSNCEQIKRTLSTSKHASLEIDSLVNGIDIQLSITRALFQKKCCKLFDRILEPVEKVLADAKLKKEEIDEIVLVGGSTRIPKVQEQLFDFFDGKKKLCKSINPDEAVAHGAAIQAAILSKVESVNDLLLIDVNPLSLGVEVGEGEMNIIIERNTNIPTEKTMCYTTAVDNQESVNIKIFEGERKQTKYNNFLGNFILTGITKAERNKPKINVTFEINANGILQVSAVEESTGKANKITITNDKDRLSQEEIQQMINDAEKFRDEDIKFKENIDAKNKLENICTIMSDKIKNVSCKEKQRVLQNKMEEIKEWMEKNPRAVKQDIDEKMCEIEKLFIQGDEQEGVAGEYNETMPLSPSLLNLAKGETATTASMATAPKIEEVE